MEAPTPFNIMFWRVLIDRPGEIWIGYRSIFDPAELPVRWTVVAKGEEIAAKHADASEVKTVQWFSEGWWIARSSADGLWLADLRFGEVRNWDDRGVALRPSFVWTYLPEGKKDRLRQHGPQARGAGETMRRMGRRISGESEAWEASPRLIGAFLALQEYLPEQK